MDEKFSFQSMIRNSSFSRILFPNHNNWKNYFLQLLHQLEEVLGFEQGKLFLQLIHNIKIQLHDMIDFIGSNRAWWLAISPLIILVIRTTSIIIFISCTFNLLSITISYTILCVAPRNPTTIWPTMPLIAPFLITVVCSLMALLNWSQSLNDVE